MSTVSRSSSEFFRRPPYQLVLLGNRLNAINSRFYQSRFGIGAIEGRVLAVLEPENDVAASDICQGLGIDQAAASRGIKTLLELGYISATGDQQDKRKRSLALTERGVAVRAELMREILRRTEIALEGFSPGERALLGE